MAKKISHTDDEVIMRAIKHVASRADYDSPSRGSAPAYTPKEMDITGRGAHSSDLFGANIMLGGKGQDVAKQFTARNYNMSGPRIGVLITKAFNEGDQATRNLIQTVNVLHQYEAALYSEANDVLESEASSNQRGMMFKGKAADQFKIFRLPLSPEALQVLPKIDKAYTIGEGLFEVSIKDEIPHVRDLLDRKVVELANKLNLKPLPPGVEAGKLNDNLRKH